MRVLVTGGGGYIGSALLKKLLERGYEVCSVDNLFRGSYAYVSNLKDSNGVKLLVGDICSLKDLEDDLNKVHFDAIVHLAAIPGLERCLKNPSRAVLTNIYGTYNILEFARENDVGKVVFSSSAAVYGEPIMTPIPEEHPLNPLNLYGVTKLAAEKLMYSYHRAYGLSTVILRLGNVYGVGAYTYWETVIPKFVRQALRGEALTIYGDGRQSRDFIHVLDVVKAIELVLISENKLVGGDVFNVASGEPLSINNLAKTVSEVVFEKLGREVNKVHLPPRSGEPSLPNFCLSINKISDKLGFKADWSVRDGIKQLVEYGLKTKLR